MPTKLQTFFDTCAKMTLFLMKIREKRANIPLLAHALLSFWQTSAARMGALGSKDIFK